MLFVGIPENFGLGKRTDIHPLIQYDDSSLAHIHFQEAEGSGRKDQITRQSVREMALTKALNAEGSTSQCVSYSSISGDVTACDQQYAR